MRRLIWSATAMLLLGLGGCVSAPPPAPKWTGGDPAHLVADQAQCEREAAGLDPNQSAGYSDPRYGVTSAMAAQIARDNPLMDQQAALRLAAVTICMGDKGWTPR
jgi:hypothetical protein